MDSSQKVIRFWDQTLRALVEVPCATSDTVSISSKDYEGRDSEEMRGELMRLRSIGVSNFGAKTKYMPAEQNHNGLLLCIA